MKSLVGIFTIILISLTLNAQHTLRGVVVDRETGSPLPFVNIVYNERGQGLTTGLDGDFEFTTTQPVEMLKLSYVGYSPHTVIVIPENYTRPMIIGLSPIAYSLDEVVVKPGINPAHRIIKEVYRNRDSNNPERLPHFRYNSYNRMYFAFQRDSIHLDAKIDEDTEINDTLQSFVDSLDMKIQRFNERQHIFMMESVTERNFKSPNNNSEKVLATRVSGLKDPFFVFLSTQFQSFSFYPELINLGGRNYLNPISRGSTSRYLFILEDTLFTQNFDTLFVISFRPLRNRNFDALRGVMTINTNGYAIQNVIAEPVEPPTLLFNLKIQQRYELIDSLQWFPVELNTDLYLRMVNAQARDTVSGQTLPISIVGVGNSYIKNIDLNPKLRSRQFNHVELTFDPLSGERDEAFWLQFRDDSLTKQERRTYHVIDSIGEAINLDKRLRFIESMVTGKIPVRFISIDLNRLMNYNRFEGYRLGLGLETDQRFLNWFTIGGYYAYGFKDKEHKYGGFGKLTLSHRHQVTLQGNYQQDVREPGEFKFQKPFGLIDTDRFRDFTISRMDYVERYSAQFNFRVFKNFKVGLVGSQNSFTIASGYETVHENISSSAQFTTTEIGTEIRFVWNETFMETPRGLLPLSFGYPLIWFNYYKGIPNFGGNLSYNRYEFRIDNRINYRTLGHTNITLSGGMVNGDIPTPLLHFSPSNMDKIPFDATKSFATMQPYEFVSDRFVYLFINHDFGKPFWKPKSRFFRPQFALAQSIGFGDYSSNTMHFFPDNPQTLTKGYFESGLLINGIISNPLFSVGIGAYYRWGPYTNPKWEDNIALRVTLRTSF